jgi:hypothetical protein
LRPTHLHRGTFIVRDLDRRRNLSRICWPTGVQVWVRRGNTVSGESRYFDLPEIEAQRAESG